MQTSSCEGILLLNKAKGKTSFSLVSFLRKKFNIKKIGHAGTLDPFATGLMVMLIGRNYTRLSDRFLQSDKEYIAKLHLGITTDTYDCEGKTLTISSLIPSLEEIEKALSSFQGKIKQIPPMFSAKKRQGKKLYELARKGIEVEREAVDVTVDIELLQYAYPYLTIKVNCSKGTYIRSLGFDIGTILKCGAHLCELERIRSGRFLLQDSFTEEAVIANDFSLHHLLKTDLLDIKEFQNIYN